MDYSDYSNAGLQLDSQKLQARIMELLEKDPVANATAIKTFQTSRKAIEKELRARELAEMEKKPPVISTTHGNRAEMGLGKDMLAAIAQIPIFDAGSETSDFLAELYNTYLNYVKDTPQLESRFVKAAISRMGKDYARQLLHSGKTVQNWDQLKEFIEHNYASKMTVYQKMHTLFQLNPEHRDWTDYATKLENHSNSVYNFIADAYSREKEGALLDGKKLMEVWTVMIFLEKLKGSTDSDAYNYITGHLDSIWNLPAVVTRAKGYLDRAIRGENLDDEAENSAFFGNTSRPAGQKASQRVVTLKDTQQSSQADQERKAQEKKDFQNWCSRHPGVCHAWAVRGNCQYEQKKGTPCPRNHFYGNDNANNPDALFTSTAFYE